MSARANLEAFEDRTLIQPYAQDAMSWAVAAGLVEGVTETSLAPKGIALRCQLAAPAPPAVAGRAALTNSGKA